MRARFRELVGGVEKKHSAALAQMVQELPWTRPTILKALTGLYKRGLCRDVLGLLLCYATYFTIRFWYFKQDVRKVEAVGRRQRAGAAASCRGGPDPLLGPLAPAPR